MIVARQMLDMYTYMMNPAPSKYEKLNALSIATATADTYRGIPNLELRNRAFDRDISTLIHAYLYTQTIT